MQSNKAFLVYGLSIALFLLAGCGQTNRGISPPAPSESIPIVSLSESASTPTPSEVLLTPTASSPQPKLLELTKEAVCERYHFSVRYPDTWTAVVEEEVIDAPDQGVIIYVDDKKGLMSSLHIFGDMRGQINPGNAGGSRSTITDFSTASGTTGKRYDLLDEENIRWDVRIFGDQEDYAIWIRLDNSFYLEYEPTINAIIDSFTFLE